MSGYSMYVVTVRMWLQYVSGYSTYVVTVCKWLQYVCGYSVNRSYLSLVSEV